MHLSRANYVIFIQHIIWLCLLGFFLDGDISFLVALSLKFHFTVDEEWGEHGGDACGRPTCCICALIRRSSCPQRHSISRPTCSGLSWTGIRGLFTCSSTGQTTTSKSSGHPRHHPSSPAPLQRARHPSSGTAEGWRCGLKRSGASVSPEVARSNPSRRGF